MTWLFESFVVVVAFFSVVLFVEIISFFYGENQNKKNNLPPVARSGKWPSVSILIPAHNESKVIAKTLRSIVSELEGNWSITVIADNCTDNTAEIAESFGVNVVSRFNHEKKGKSYALEFGISSLREKSPDFVVIIDADCIVDRGALHSLVLHSEASNSPVQGCYMMEATPGSGVKTRVSQFAWRIKNLVRPSGLSQLGMPNQLMGSGMIFPWRIFESLNLANGSIVEDLVLGLNCGSKGWYPQFCREAVVRSEFPISDDAANTQKTRWEHGHLSVIFKVAPKIVMRAICSADFKLFVLAVDAAIPPLFLLFLLQALSVCAAVGLTFSGIWGSLYLSLVSILVSVFSIVAIWNYVGRDILKASELILIPFLLLKKVSIYIRFFSAPEKAWVKTKR